MEVTSFVPDYSKSMQFQSVEFLNEGSSSNLPTYSSSDFPKIVKCQHCDKVGHMIDKCFDLHPCMHRGKHTHCSAKCFLLKKFARKKFHYVVAYIGGGLTYFDTSCS